MKAIAYAIATVGCLAVCLYASLNGKAGIALLASIWASACLVGLFVQEPDGSTK